MSALILSLGSSRLVINRPVCLLSALRAETHTLQQHVPASGERRKVQKRYKEYDGCYLGHYAQWFFWFFFVLGFFIFTSAIVMMVGRWCNWF